MRRRAVLMAVLAAACLVAAGCGGTDEPPRADPAPSPSATTSPSPTAPVLPEAAKANTKAGAVAFARHYVDLINHAQATGDTKALAAVELTACHSCATGRRYVEDIYRIGGHITGGKSTVKDVIGAIHNPSIHGYEVDFIVRFAPQVIYRPGAPAKRVKGRALPISFQVSQRSGTWRVQEWTRGA